MMTEKSGVCVIMADVSGEGVWVLAKEVGSFGADAGEKYPHLKRTAFPLKKATLACSF